MNFNNKKFGFHLRLKQAEFRLTVTNAAKEIGISKATLSRLNREHVPDVETYFKCCQWLKIDMDFFF